MVQLEDLFVSEEHRAHGLGKRLFGELGHIAKERKCGRVEWRVLKVRLIVQRAKLSPDAFQWNQPSIDFYVKRLKAEPQSEWEGMRIEGAEGIEMLAQLRQ